jgi:hypothetical protein
MNISCLESKEACALSELITLMISVLRCYDNTVTALLCFNTT